MSFRARLISAWPLLVLALTSLYVAWTPPLRAVLLNFVPLVFAITLVAAFVGIGAPIATRLVPGSSRVDQILLAAAFGAGLTGLVVFVPGVFLIVNPGIYALWVLLGLLGCLVFVLTRWRQDPLSFAPTTALSTLALVLIVVNLLQILPMLLSPVVTTDAMEYHLMVPKITLANGGIHPLPTLMESHYPALASYLYLLIMPLAGDVACKAMHFCAGIGLLIAIARLVARSAPEAGRLLAPALYVTMPVAVNLFAWAWNDNLFVFFLLLAFAQLLDYHDEPDRPGSWRHLCAAGLLMGLAAWTKYTIVMVLVALAPALLIALWRWKWRFSHVVVLAAPIGLISLLVFVKNWLFTGNPFFPFLNDVFPSPFWNEATDQVFHNALRRWEHPDWHWHTYLTFPLNLSLRPKLIDVHTGILLLAAAPFAFYRSRTHAQVFLKLFLLSCIATWLVFQTETRSLLLFFALLLVVAAPNLERAVFQVRDRRRAGLVALAIGAFASFWIAVVSSSLLTEPTRYLFGLEDRRDFLFREAEAYPTLQWLNTHPQVQGAVLVGLKRPYYAEKPVWFSAFADIPIAEVLTRQSSTALQMVKRFQTIGATHIVVDWEVWKQDHKEGLYSWSSDTKTAFAQVIGDHCLPVATFGATTVYAIKTEPRDEIQQKY